MDIETKNYDVLIFDMNNLYFRASESEDTILAVHNNQKLQTQGIAGSISRIQYHIKNHLKKGGIIYFLFDSSNGGLRIESLNINYKSNRKSKPKPFWRGLDYLEYILLHYKDGNYILRTPEIEADNWVKPVIKSLDKDKKILMISTDMDFSRSVNENVHWYSHYHNKTIFTPKEFEEKYGFTPSESNVAFYKCFYGDSSDNIEGLYSQMSPKKFKYILNNFKDMKGFLIGCREKSIPLFNDAINSRMIRERHSLTNNWDLVSYKAISQEVLNKHSVKTKENLLNLKLIYKSLGLDVDKRTKSSQDVMDDLLNKEFVKRG